MPRAQQHDALTAGSHGDGMGSLVVRATMPLGVLWYVHDALGRKTELRDDSAAGDLRAE
ncbi:hypothetical protein GCM10010429_31510 [Micromonospora olivasterospora]